jgi:uncharacterized protein with PIN domain
VLGLKLYTIMSIMAIFNVFLEKLIDLRNEYLQADEATKRFLEQRYGKRVIQKALEEMESKDWLEKNSKSCPCCGTPIQVTFRADSRAQVPSEAHWSVVIVRF